MKAVSMPSRTATSFVIGGLRGSTASSDSCFGNVQFSVKQKFAVSVQRIFGSVRGIKTILNKQLHPSTLS